MVLSLKEIRDESTEENDSILPGFRSLSTFLSISKIDRMTKQLPKHEFWEEGQQIGKSSQGIPAHIAEWKRASTIGL